MSTLSSSSTIEEIIAAYDDNASYAEDGSVAKAKAFITAVRILLRFPKRERKGGASGAEHEFDPATLREELKDAQLYVEQNDETLSVLDVDFTEFDARE